MISEQKLVALILESLKNVKDADAVYKDWIVNEKTIALGTRSSMDSVAFTTFVTDLEEKIEKEIQSPYELDLTELYGDQPPAEINFSVSDIAHGIHRTLQSR